MGIRKRAKHPAKRSGMETLKVLFATLFGLAEPSGKEERTIAHITAFLGKEEGLKIVDIPGAGKIFISMVDATRPTIVWRGDVDGLPTPDGGCAHLCGHHAHTAIGAQLLLEHARAITNGTIGEKTPNLILALERAEERPDLNRVDDLATEIKKIVDPATSQIVAIHTAYLPPMPDKTPRPPGIYGTAKSPYLDITGGLFSVTLEGLGGHTGLGATGGEKRRGTIVSHGTRLMADIEQVLWGISDGHIGQTVAMAGTVDSPNTNPDRFDGVIMLRVGSDKERELLLTEAKMVVGNFCVEGVRVSTEIVRAYPIFQNSSETHALFKDACGRAGVFFSEEIPRLPAADSIGKWRQHFRGGMVLFNLPPDPENGYPPVPNHHPDYRVPFSAVADAVRVGRAMFHLPAIDE